MRFSPASAGKRSAGFTLLEALVVVALMALVAGLAFPRVERLRESADFASARTALTGAVAAARARAIRTDAAVSLTSSPDNTALLAGGTLVARLPPGLRALPQGRAMTFFRDGSTSGGAFILIGNRQRATLTLGPTTGRLQWRD